MKTCPKGHLYVEGKWCNACQRERHKNRTPEQIERARENARKWWENNKDTHYNSIKKYRKSHPERYEIQRQKYQSDNPIRMIWKGMVSRCHNPKDPSYEHYGAKGIIVAEEWREKEGYERFCEYIGPRPSRSHSVDRIKNAGNYEPGNVRWATKTEQAENRSTTRFVQVDGRTQSYSAWAREIGITSQAFRIRIRRGLTGKNLIKPRNGNGALSREACLELALRRALAALGNKDYDGRFGDEILLERK